MNTKQDTKTPRRRGLSYGLSCFLLAGLSMLLHACAYYEPIPDYYPSSSYELAWDSALSAAEDVGILITSTDRASGTIQGRKGSTDVDIYVMRQTDGRLRVELNLRRPEDEHKNLAERFRRSFERHMGVR